MFEGANTEFRDVLEALGIGGFNDVRWDAELVANLAAAFDLIQREQRGV
jgi:hypothetical protein